MTGGFGVVPIVGRSVSQIDEFVEAKIIVPARASGTACPIVASRAVATAARITAVDPCGQALRIQK